MSLTLADLERWDAHSVRDVASAVNGLCSRRFQYSPTRVHL
jgi:hypothetical protein